MASSKDSDKIEYENNKQKLSWYKDKRKPVSRDVGLFAVSSFLMIGVLYGWGVVSLQQGDWFPVIVTVAIGFLVYRGSENTRHYEETIKADISLCQSRIDRYERTLTDESRK